MYLLPDYLSLLLETGNYIISIELPSESLSVAPSCLLFDFTMILTPDIDSSDVQCQLQVVRSWKIC